MQHKVAEGLADAHICYFVLICILQFHKKTVEF